jgi:hypothetical protein
MPIVSKSVEGVKDKVEKIPDTPLATTSYP